MKKPHVNIPSPEPDPYGKQFVQRCTAMFSNAIEAMIKIPAKLSMFDVETGVPEAPIMTVIVAVCAPEEAAVLRQAIEHMHAAKRATDN